MILTSSAVFTIGIGVGGLIGSYLERRYLEKTFKKAGRLMVSRDDDGMYMTAAIESMDSIRAGNIVYFDVFEVVQNDAE